MLNSACSEDWRREQYECEPTPQIGHPQEGNFEAFLRKHQRAGLPGMVLHIRDDSGEWAGAAGYADLKTRDQLRTCNRFRVASISKLFASVAVLRLVEQSQLELDGKISYEINDQGDLANFAQATTRQVLNHQSGIYACNESLRYGTDLLNDPTTNHWTPDRCLSYAQGHDAYFEPGTGFHYSNTNYVLVGKLLEMITGESRYDALDELVLEPLELHSTVFNPDAPIPNGTVRGYADTYGDGSVLDTTAYAFGFQTLDGEIVSTSDDLVALLDSVVYGRFLTAESLEAMTTWIDVGPDDPESDRGFTKYGLGMRYWDTEYGPAIGHSGETFGYLAFAFTFPERDTTVAMLINGSYSEIDTRAEAALAGLPELLFGAG